MTTKEYKEIESLLERFFEGLTTGEEEGRLYRFFSTREDLPQEWAPYRSLFACFEKELPLACTAESKPFPPRRKRGIVWWGASVAAAVGLVLLLHSYFHRETVFEPYEGSYLVRNGVRITDLDLIRPELEATLQEVMEEQAMMENLLKEEYEALPEQYLDEALRTELSQLFKLK
ncbi:MAG: hypothetical protein LBQ65_05700 [Tannerellaceae bacterium]|jgi:hypothetical protein|nr:hypothetical protein [Tannerellaceae bacterium]